MILIKVVFLQIVVASVILFVLWQMLKRELVQVALHTLEGLAVRRDLTEVSVVSACVLQPSDDARLRAALKEKFPVAAVNISVNAGIRAGLVVQAGDLLIDQCFLTRIKHLLGG